MRVNEKYYEMWSYIYNESNSNNNKINNDNNKNNNNMQIRK